MRTSAHVHVFCVSLGNFFGVLSEELWLYILSHFSPFTFTTTFSEFIARKHRPQPRQHEGDERQAHRFGWRGGQADDHHDLEEAAEEREARLDARL